MLKTEAEKSQILKMIFIPRFRIFINSRNSHYFIQEFQEASDVTNQCCLCSSSVQIATIVALCDFLPLDQLKWSEQDSPGPSSSPKSGSCQPSSRPIFVAGQTASFAPESRWFEPSFQFNQMMMLAARDSLVKICGPLKEPFQSFSCYISFIRAQLA